MSQPTVSTKPVVKLTPSMILESSLKRLPNFTAKSDLELLIMILTTYVGSEVAPVSVQLGKEKALKTLITFGKIKSKSDIDTAHMNVMKALAAVMSVVYSSFEASTGGKFSRDDFSFFEKEFARETVEQDSFRSKAEKALDRVRIVCGQLGLANPDPALKKSTEPAAIPVVKHEGSLRLFARSLGTAFFKDEKIEENESVPVEKPKPGWTTPSVLNKRFDELDAFLSTVEDYILTLEESKKTDSKIDVAKDTLSFMSSQGFDSEAITSMLTEFATISREQITQSIEIIANILPEYNSAKENVQAIADVKSIADAVKFYFD
jgi:hypothetical protein